MADLVGPQRFEDDAVIAHWDNSIPWGPSGTSASGEHFAPGG